jgi:hypothetical protein
MQEHVAPAFSGPSPLLPSALRSLLQPPSNTPQAAPGPSNQAPPSPARCARWQGPVSLPDADWWESGPRPRRPRETTQRWNGKEEARLHGNTTAREVKSTVLSVSSTCLATAAACGCRHLLSILIVQGTRYAQGRPFALGRVSSIPKVESWWRVAHLRIQPAFVQTLPTSPTYVRK